MRKLLETLATQRHHAKTQASDRWLQLVEDQSRGQAVDLAEITSVATVLGISQGAAVCALEEAAEAARELREKEAAQAAINAQLPQAEAKSLAAAQFFSRYESERLARHEDLNRPAALGLQLGTLQREIYLARARATAVPQPVSAADMPAVPIAGAQVATVG
jgi:hypothetical protein